MTRHLLNLLTVLSLLLCAAVTAMWVRSYWYLEGFGIELDPGAPEYGYEYSDAPLHTHFDLSGVYVHYGVLVAFTLALPTLRLMLLFVKRFRQQRRTQQGRCPACDYDLRATPGRCPECGHDPGGMPA